MTAGAGVARAGRFASDHRRRRVDDCTKRNRKWTKWTLRHAGNRLARGPDVFFEDHRIETRVADMSEYVARKIQHCEGAVCASTIDLIGGLDGEHRHAGLGPASRAPRSVARDSGSRDKPGMTLLNRPTAVCYHRRSDRRGPGRSQSNQAVSLRELVRHQCKFRAKDDHVRQRHLIPRKAIDRGSGQRRDGFLFSQRCWCGQK